MSFLRILCVGVLCALVGCSAFSKEDDLSAAVTESVRAFAQTPEGSAAISALLAEGGLQQEDVAQLLELLGVAGESVGEEKASVDGKALELIMLALKLQEEGEKE